jgi:SAM-dependent methyltransferase
MLKVRSQEKELLDLGPEYFGSAEYTQCLKILFWINQLLGFYRSTVRILQSFAKTSTVLDIGCGGGLFLLHLSKVFPQMKMLGTDISAPAILDAERSLQCWRKKNSHTQVTFRFQRQPRLDYAENSFDIILATLICHHLNHEELIDFLQQAYRVAKTAVIINDLHRHRLAHGLYRIISPLFRNRLITHDGLISIRRGFIRSELESLLNAAGIQHYQLKWCFPFRWQLILWKTDRA